MTLKIAFSVDDVAPIPSHGLLKEEDNLKYLFKLNKELGVKFTLFVVPNWEGKANILEHKDWFNWLSSFDFFEIANHGCQHINVRNGTSVEFSDVDVNTAERMIKYSQGVFESLGVKPIGMKFPGWDFNPEIMGILPKLGFKYLADHFVSIHPVKLSNGFYRIPYTLSVENLHSNHYDTTLILHSHIAVDKQNKNGWTDKIYEEVRSYLKEIIDKNKGDVKFITFSELIK